MYVDLEYLRLNALDWDKKRDETWEKPHLYSPLSAMVMVLYIHTCLADSDCCP